MLPRLPSAPEAPPQGDARTAARRAIERLRVLIAGALALRRRRRVAEDAIAAYLAWWQECNGVRAAYRAWLSAPRDSAAFAFRDYSAALEREARAAEMYAAQARRIARLA